MRTKSLRIASDVSSSTILVPVRPPARPVATTGTSRRLSARATLIPLPPASVSPPLARCRWPLRKFGTVSVRSSAAFIVTVTIIGSLSGDPPPHVVRGPAYIPAYASGQARPPDRPRGHERRGREQAFSRVDAHLAEPLA